MQVRDRQSICLSGIFLVMIALVAPSQIILELREGDSPRITELLRQKPTHTNLRHLERSLEEECRIGQTVRPWMQFARFVLLHDAGKNAIVGRDGWLFYRPAVQYLIEPWRPEDEMGHGNVFDAVISFRDELSKRGIQLLLVPAPNKASVYPEKLAKRTARRNDPVNPATRAILTRLKDAGIEVVDLFTVYEQAKQTPDSPVYYLSQDSHWSPAGMRLAAEVVAQRLLELGWAQKGTAKYEARPASVLRHGDVLKMMQVPPAEKLLDPQAMDCTQVVDAQTGRLYEDDPNAPVLVLGDSFLRIFERDEPGSAGFVAHLAYHLGSGVTSLISDGGASTLVRQELARKPALLKGKKVVVWEFVERDIRFGTEGWQRVPLPSADRSGRHKTG